MLKSTPKEKKSFFLKIMGQIFISSEYPEYPETSLEKDMRRLMNDKRFHDITLKCSDGVVVSGCKAILATRSKIFKKYMPTGPEKYNNLLKSIGINSNSMKIILEYLYTSRVKLENVTVTNIIEVYHASIHFELLEFQLEICLLVLSFLKAGNEHVGKKLLSECVNKFSLEVNNEMSR